jgi:hypothetical protein
MELILFESSGSDCFGEIAAFAFLKISIFVVVSIVLVRDIPGSSFERGVHGVPLILYISVKIQTLYYNFNVRIK